MSLDSALRARIETVLSSNPVVLFLKGTPSAPQCGFSARAVAALDATGADYAHVNVLADPDIREGIKVFGDWPTIPQLYVHGELVGGADIISQMAGSGELHAALGLPAPDRTPPQITITPAAAQMLKQALDNAGPGYALQIEIDRGFNARLQLAERDDTAITTESEGIRAQFDLVSAQRARGMQIDWADDARGKGLVIDNPNAPPKVGTLTPAETRDRVAAGTLTLVDVRPAQERALAEVPVASRNFDDGVEDIEALPKDQPLAFICQAGARSQQAAEHFRALGFTHVYNVAGGTNAWAELDPTVPRY
ncbi:Grx4 family monothiol glutaredoxin [Thermomonas sp.]|uniref:Grx4 family monothiol glutaredoxin n=1 Tax=Thermomonas sp. TaxID=1971895 RepID=UPI001D29AFF7|nr:Grx4 family monothiol glutaredoxin [Thermomonas sp.]MBZ0086701.1 Grx4 family monothiol glutaredoxin [Thermomonas sp.]MCO5055755.1 Grx4 family monothiol glutaredoxin [Thermomonas sp.]HRO62842.1 Grx4 family monothiol glutaredoxin [Thermomonas sp.]